MVQYWRGLDVTYVVVLTVLAVSQIYFVSRDSERLFRSLHIYESKDPSQKAPQTYFSMDWLIHPKNSHHSQNDFKMVVSSEAGTCYTSGMYWDSGDCGPEYWQRSYFCPTKKQLDGEHTIIDSLIQFRDANLNNDRHVKIGSAIEQLDVFKQLYDETNTENGAGLTKSTTGTYYTWANPNLADVCQMERIGPSSVILNDDTSWGIASGHSVSILALGAVLIMWIANITELANNSEHSASNYAKMWKKGNTFTLAVLVILFIFLHQMSLISKTSNSDIYIVRNLANGSYFYAILLVSIASYIFARCDKKCKSMKAEKETSENPSEADSLMSEPGPETQNAHLYTPLRQIGLDVSGFATNNKIQLNAYMPRTASKMDGIDSNRADAFKQVLEINRSRFLTPDFDIESSLFCVSQALALPLLLIANYIFSINYDIDSNFQVLVWSIVAFGLVDVIVHRFYQILKIYHSLMPNGTNTESVHVDDHKVLYLGKIINYLGLLLQIFLFLVIFVLMKWPLGLGTREFIPILGNSSNYENVMQYSPFLFLVYFVVTIFTKLASLMSSNRFTGVKAVQGDGKMWSLAKTVEENAHEILFISLNVFVIVLVGLMSWTMYQDVYVSPLDVLSKNDALMKVSNDVVQYYRSGWHAHVVS